MYVPPALTDRARINIYTCKNVNENFSFIDIKEVSDSESYFSLDFNLKDLKGNKILIEDNSKTNHHDINLDPNNYRLEKRSFINFKKQSNNKTIFNKDGNIFSECFEDKGNESKSKLKGPIIKISKKKYEGFYFKFNKLIFRRKN